MLKAIEAKLHELRPSAIVAVRQRTASTDPIETLDVLVESLGFRAIGKNWQEINKECAASLLTRVLQHNLAYTSSLEMDHQEAENLTNSFLSSFPGPVEFFTNGVFTKNGGKVIRWLQRHLKRVWLVSVEKDRAYSGC